MPQLKLLSITCMQTDESDKDEIYLKINDKKIWPEKSKFYPIDADENVTIGLQFNWSSPQCHIDLWEFDFIGSNELLGSFEFDVETPGSYSEVMSNISGEASYILNYEIN